VKPGELLRESIVATIRRLTPSVMIALLVAAACAATILTVGRTTAAEEQMRARLDSAGARLISVQDVSSTGLVSPAAVSVIAHFSTVERAIATSVPVDARADSQGAGGTRIPLWELQGSTPAGVQVTDGRLPGLGEAVISEAAARVLGIDAPVGAIAVGSRSWAIVGFFRARAPFTDFDKGVIAPANASTTTPLLYVVAHDAVDVDRVAHSVGSVLAPRSGRDLTVSVPDTLAQLQALLGSDLGGLGHSLLLLILTGGSALVAVVVFADTLVRRSDLGRRRALGMPRGTMVAFILLRTAICAAAGAFVGCVSSEAYLALAGTPVPVAFTVATGLLAVIAAAIASLAPSIIAALADPVRVLRTP